jgi:hypothetical protein
MDINQFIAEQREICPYVRQPHRDTMSNLLDMLEVATSYLQSMTNITQDVKLQNLGNEGIEKLKEMAGKQ